MKNEEIFSLVKEMWQWLAIKNVPQKSDLIFLIGGSSLETPKKGLELFRQGLAPYMVTTGKTGTGDDSGWNKPIADVFADFLLKNKVPEDRFIVQNRSMNTLEDVVFTMEIIKKMGIPCQKIIIVSRPFHQRRCFATFKKQYPEKIYFNVPNDEKIPSEKEIEKLREIGLRCLQEYERLEKYANKGDIEKQFVPAKISKIYQKFHSLLFV